MRVAQKVETIREDLGKVGPVHRRAGRGGDARAGGRRWTPRQAEAESEPIRRMLKFERDLQKQIQALMEQYRETRRNCGSRPENIQKVVEVGLELAGQPPLDPDQDRPTASRAFRLPPLQGKLGGLRRGAGAPAHEGDPPRSPSTTPSPRGGTTWCWPT